ncbi:MAG: arginine-tRNA-protein transferase [Bacteroidetes bacterium]|nr:MAG: arginine-tRNA-protein transferase [Bacteroidota bacterium]
MTPFAEKHYPDYLPPEELDRYLERGWYRMGQTIFTTHFLCFKQQLYSAIWVRLHLPSHSFRKSQRKLMRRNGTRFRIVFQDESTITAEKEALFRRYRKTFKGFLGNSLAESLYDAEENNIYDTREVQIYNANRLIGLSFFDVGKNSAASITGIYDPAYKDFSLGYYTMLLEIKYCQEHGLTYYYPGYVVPGFERFDYKLRIGEVSYYTLDQQNWEPYQQLEPAKIPINLMETRLLELSQQMTQFNVPHQLYRYPLFEASLFGFWDAPYLEYPWLIQLPDTGPNYLYFAVYNVRNHHYELLRCTPFDDLNFYFNESYTRSFNPEEFFMRLSVVDNLLYSVESAKDFARYLRDKQDRLI